MALVFYIQLPSLFQSLCGRFDRSEVAFGKSEMMEEERIDDRLYVYSQEI